MNETITITISPQGKAIVETEGFTGQSCRDASKFIEQALGRSASETLKPEYYIQETEKNEVYQ